jgi:hypothetical protein
LGTSDRFIAEFNESTIVGGEGNVQARGAVKSVSKRVSLSYRRRCHLKDWRRVGYRARYLKDKAEDTVNAVRVAFKDGVVRCHTASQTVKPSLKRDVKSIRHAKYQAAVIRVVQ